MIVMGVLNAAIIHYSENYLIKMARNIGYLGNMWLK